MSFTITRIRKQKPRPYDDVYHHPDGSTTASPAPVLASFILEVVVDGHEEQFNAEIRKGASLQIDWDDAFQDLMMQHRKSDEDWGIVSRAIVAAFERQESGCPITVGAKGV